MEDTTIIGYLIQATTTNIINWTVPPPSDLQDKLKYSASFNYIYWFSLYGSTSSSDRLRVYYKGEIIYELGIDLDQLVVAIKTQIASRHSTQMIALEQALQEALTGP